MTVAKSDTVVASDSWAAIFTDLASVDPRAAEAHAKALTLFGELNGYIAFQKWIVKKWPDWMKSPSLQFLMGAALAMGGEVQRGMLLVKRAESAWRQIQKDRVIKSALLKRIEIKAKEFRGLFSYALRNRHSYNTVIASLK